MCPDTGHDFSKCRFSRPLTAKKGMKPDSKRSSKTQKQLSVLILHLFQDCDDSYSTENIYHMAVHALFRRHGKWGGTTCLLYRNMALQRLHANLAHEFHAVLFISRRMQPTIYFYCFTIVINEKSACPILKKVDISVNK